MASPNQMVVSKGLQNLLIAEDLLKILKDRIPFRSSRILYQFPFMDSRSKKKVLLKFLLAQRPITLVLMMINSCSYSTNDLVFN